MIYFGKVTNGVLKIHNRKLFDKEIASFEGKEVQIKVEKKKKFRSSPQNRYFHSILKIIREGLRDAGFNEFRTDEQVKDLIKYKFLIVTETNEQGEFIGRVKSTTELSTSEFMDFIAEIQIWATEFLNIYIPEPNEILTLDL